MDQSVPDGMSMEVMGTFGIYMRKKNHLKNTFSDTGMDTQSATCALWNAAHHHGRRGLELEFRLGHMMGSSFVSNIGKAHFDACTQYLQQRCESQVRISTTEMIRGDTKHVVTHSLDDKPPPPPYTMTKKRLFHTEFPTQPFAVRASIAFENRVETTAPPKGRVTKRQKQRTRYIWGPWAYDLTVVVSNADLDSEETYELELELLDTMAFFEHTMDYLVEWGLQLVTTMVSSCAHN